MHDHKNNLNSYISGNISHFWLISSTLLCILVSIYSLQTGYTIIFQNLFYIPIILACIFYTWKGFLFSCLLACTYFVLMAGYTQDNLVLFQAFIRVILFVSIAGVITFLALGYRRSEEAMRHLTEFQDNIISNARVWIMVLDHNGTPLLWNTAAEEISGYRSDEVVGKNDIWKRIYPDKTYRTQITQAITRIISEEKYLDNFETTIQTKNGEETAISWNTKHIPDGAGELSTYIAIGVNVTDRQKAESAYKEQTKFIHTLINTLPVPVFYKNRDGIYTGCNTAYEQSFGMSRDQIIGKTVYDLWPKEFADVYYLADQEVFDSSSKQQYESSTRYADGTIHQVVFFKAPLLDKVNQVTGLIGAILDISDRKRGEEALRESNQKLRLLTSLTRHDIFNQINAIQLFFDLALTSSDPAKIHEYISHAQQAGELMERTIGFTKEYENFGTTSGGWQQIRETIESAKLEVFSGDVFIYNEIPGDLEIYADPIIRKVFATLLENAIRHGEKISFIKFASSMSANSLIITCVDDGIGIPDEEKELIFDHGYGKHTGIGLFLAREILSITGLSIRECGEPGTGATFEILVPPGKYHNLPGDVI
ncbi:MAG TPA: PAS domain S-box protein [Methanospirillum sp.]|nr:PAS domain S-box protein [Methanospirillum sp.]